jgi:metal-sulfur cluster biosynthetic enzyme
LYFDVIAAERNSLQLNDSCLQPAAAAEMNKQMTHRILQGRLLQYLPLIPKYDLGFHVYNLSLIRTLELLAKQRFRLRV